MKSRLSKVKKWLPGLFPETYQNAVFIWIPKTAGTSVFTSLQDANCEIFKTKETIESDFPNEGVVTFGHVHYPLIKKANLVSDEFDRGSWKFCFCRNTYDRFLSLHSYLQKYDVVPTSTTFEDFCRQVGRDGCPPVGLYNQLGISQCNPQTHWLEGVDIDFIGRFENIGRDLRFVRKNLGLKSSAPPHMNKSHRPALAEGYTQETADIIYDFYRDDFDVFGYERMTF